MSVVEQYAPGTPSWIDVSSPDPDAAAAFYTAVFGWEATEPGPVEETGGYRMFQRDGKSIAGLGPVQQGAPPAWTTYVTVADADASVAAATQAGAQPLLPPMDVLRAGRMAILADPTGAVVALWQPRDHIGAELVNEPGTLVWNELSTRDAAAAQAFYATLFGWTFETAPTSGGEYTTARLGERPVAGMMEMGDQFPAEIPPHWGHYIAVEDLDATLAAVTANGGTTLFGPMSIDIGRFATVADPFGAAFSVIQMNELPA